jgi:hypothetical protein
LRANVRYDRAIRVRNRFSLQLAYSVPDTFVPSFSRHRS